MSVFNTVALASAYARSLLAFYIDGSPRPFSATFAVTNRCNLRCSYCNSPFLDPTELDLGQIRLLFQRLRRMGIRRLGLAGGEPLLRADFPQIVRTAREVGFWISVNSNLSLFERRGSCLYDANLVYTSLDGPPAVHAATRGDPNAGRVVNAARTLVRAGVPVVAICVVTERNLTAVEPLLQIAEDAGFRVHFQPQCVDTELVRGKPTGSVSPAEWQQFWRLLADEKRRGRPIASSTPYLEALSAWPDFAVSAVYQAHVRCAAGRGYLYIDPQGVAYPCAYTKGKTKGIDLLTEEWTQSWDRDTPCTQCVVGPMLEFNLLFRKPLRTAWEHARTTLSFSGRLIAKHGSLPTAVLPSRKQQGR
ncbi:MAG: radical SAM protein [Candidatus Binatia bacterium]|nr:radical SAM protein [Candidatus Binatia bacterium]